MTNRAELAKTMQERVLSLGEILKHAFGILNERFASFLLLVLLVYLPVNFVLQYAMMQVDFSVTEFELLVDEMMDLGIVQIVLSFLELVAIVVTAVMVHNQIFGQKILPFGTVFYRGVRSWLRAVMSVMVIMLGLMMCILSMGIMFMMPGMAMMMLPVILLLIVVYSMMQYCSCSAAALRGYWGLRNIRYVSLVLKGYMGKAIGNTAVILLITGGVTTIFNLLLSNMLYYISNEWIALAVNVGFSTLFSMLTVYGYVAGIMLFLNIEEKKRREVEIARQMAEQQRQQM